MISPIIYDHVTFSQKVNCWECRDKGKEMIGKILWSSLSKEYWLLPISHQLLNEAMLNDISTFIAYLTNNIDRLTSNNNPRFI